MTEAWFAATSDGFRPIDVPPGATRHAARAAYLKSIKRRRLPRGVVILKGTMERL